MGNNRNTLKRQRVRISTSIGFYRRSLGASNAKTYNSVVLAKLGEARRGREGLEREREETPNTKGMVGARKMQR